MKNLVDPFFGYLREYKYQSSWIRKSCSLKILKILSAALNRVTGWVESIYNVCQLKVKSAWGMYWFGYFRFWQFVIRQFWPHQFGQELRPATSTQQTNAGTRVKSVKWNLRFGVCSVRHLNILLALNEIAQRWTSTLCIVVLFRLEQECLFVQQNIPHISNLPPFSRVASKLLLLTKICLVGYFTIPGIPKPLSPCGKIRTALDPPPNNRAGIERL